MEEKTADVEVKERPKTLATCTPLEFLRQSNAIKKQVERWFKLTDIPNIRKHLPEVPPDATKEEKDALIKEQSMKNLSEMFDAALEDHPEETLAILALCCFVPVEEANDRTMDFYFECLSDLIDSESVANFFTSLVRLGLKLGK